MDISIIVPAYNSADTLPRLVEAVAGQTYGRDRMELIVVDDCSADATLQLARDAQERFAGMVRVCSTERQSGSPAQPRNIGLAQARGDYVFFHDADDWLAPQAVERMVRHALAWNSDVLLVKPVGEGGRAVPKSMFKANQPRVDIYRSKVMWTFGPNKLFRRSLVADLRFPSFMPEDISFVLRAYLAARVVSVAADYDYYHVSAAEDATHASVTSWDDVDSNLLAYEDVFGLIQSSVPRSRWGGVLMKRLFKRDICNTLRTIGAEPDIEKAQDQLMRLTSIVRPFYRPEQLWSLPKENRDLLRAAFGTVR